MPQPVKLGIVGLGRWAKVLTRAVQKSDKLRIVAGYSRSEEKRAAFEKELGVPAAPDMKALLADSGIKGVVLTVPNEQHFSLAEEVAKAKKHVYTEKPLTLGIAEARQLQRIAKAKKLQVAGAPDTFLGGSHQLARKAVDEGLVGKIAGGTAHIMSRGMEHWHPNPDFFFKPGGGPVLDMGPYYITNLVNLLGPVKRVAALTSPAARSSSSTLP